MWDKKMEDISKDEISDESIQRLKDNLFNIDKHLAPYPYEIWQKWKLLTTHITGKYLMFMCFYIIIIVLAPCFGNLISNVHKQ